MRGQAWTFRTTFRAIVLAAWTVVLALFWWGAQRSDAGPVPFLLGLIEQASSSPWAPVALLGLYLARPLLLIPITVANLATGFVLGAWPGIALALAGTLLSASTGYAIGRFMGSAALTARLAERWSIVRMLRRRAFESVVAGGLMYLHADMVNLPAGLLRVRMPVFLAGIVLGNALTMTTAVLAGASVEGRLDRATVSVDTTYLALAGGLFVLSLALAYALRRRVQPLA